MRSFANLFLLFFFLDGVFSLIDGLLKGMAGSDAAAVVRQPLALVAVLLAFLLLILIAIDQRLPKRLLLPLIGFTFWGGVGLWPLSVWVAPASLLLLGASGQLLLALFAFARVRRRGGRLLLTAQAFAGPSFHWRTTLTFATAGLVLLPFVLVFLLLASASHYLDRQTAGFMRLTPAGISMAERTYRQGDKTIRLAGMIHVGKEDYYRDLAGALDPGRTIVLTEGVSDNDRLLRHRFDYRGVGEALGLVSQESLLFDGERITLDALEAVPEQSAVQAPGPHILRADVDLNQFDPKTVEFLNLLGSTLLNRDAPGSGLARYQAWVAEHMTPELMQTLMADILYRRNGELVRVLQLSVGRYDTVVIPWGALHMPGIEAAVIDQGFRLEAEQRRLSLDFRQLPYGRLFTLLVAAASAGG